MRLALAAERSRANADAVRQGEAVESVELDQRDMLRLATVDAAGYGTWTTRSAASRPASRRM